MSCSITLLVSLLHCFPPETSFVLDLLFYNGNTKGTIAFNKSHLGEKLLAFMLLYCYHSIKNYYTYENSKYNAH